VASGAVNAAGKLTTIIAGMMCGADSIDDVNVLRAGGTPRVFDEVYAPSTLGILLLRSGIAIGDGDVAGRRRTSRVGRGDDLTGA
jgi:hypothetical protein